MKIDWDLHRDSRTREIDLVNVWVSLNPLCNCVARKGRALRFLKGVMQYHSIKSRQVAALALSQANELYKQ